MPNTALLVIDVQNEYFTGTMPITYPKDSFSNILSSIDVAHQNNIPVILIQHVSKDPTARTFRRDSHEVEIHPEVLAKGYDLITQKHQASSLYQTTLKAFLKEHHIDTVVISGYMTQMCCDTTARHAAHLGYKVKFLSDATGTLNLSSHTGSITAKQLHEATLITQSLFFSEVLTLEEWQTQLS